jgi:hypothetical protein
MGFVGYPSTGAPGRVHSRDVAASSAHRCQTASRVPSSWFLTTATVYSAPRPAGLLHPATGHGVRCVSSALSSTPEGVPSLASSPHRVHTLRRIPLVGSRSASPRPLPSCRYRSHWSAGWRLRAERAFRVGPTARPKPCRLTDTSSACRFASDGPKPAIYETTFAARAPTCEGRSSRGVAPRGAPVRSLRGLSTRWCSAIRSQ